MIPTEIVKQICERTGVSPNQMLEYLFAKLYGAHLCAAAAAGFGSEAQSLANITDALGGPFRTATQFEYPPDQLPRSLLMALHVMVFNDYTIGQLSPTDDDVNVKSAVLQVLQNLINAAEHRGLEEDMKFDKRD
jgi:hypothetical protein